ncbi:hypothetical protein [Luteibacter sp. dw_328]|uniref:hypothetical protein n=1 Tax=Luteibacter sp. dw_328 TaxID=2719796 RepID=UPI001BD1F1A6|nr:hypothetical protein [Luteibacter sp. dw_328]
MRRTLAGIAMLLLLWPVATLAGFNNSKDPVPHYGMSQEALERAYVESYEHEGFYLSDRTSKKSARGSTWTTTLVFTYRTPMAWPKSWTTLEVTTEDPAKCTPCMVRRLDFVFPGHDAKGPNGKYGGFQMMALADNRAVSAAAERVNAVISPARLWEPDYSTPVPKDWPFITWFATFLIVAFLTQREPPHSRLSYLRLLVAGPLFVVSSYLLIRWKFVVNEGAASGVGIVWLIAMVIGWLALILGVVLVAGFLRKKPLYPVTAILSAIPAICMLMSK